MLPTRGAVYILLGFAVIGVLGTLLTSNEPGSTLGLFIIVGSVIAALAIRLRSVYLLIPLPALVFFVAAVLTGAVHDSGIDTSKTEISVSFLQWIAGVFFGMCVATILVVVISGGRWLFSRMLVSGQLSKPPGPGPRTPPAGQRADRDRRPARDSDPWGAADPWADRGSSGGQRANRGQADGRDPWGSDRRQPSDRGYPGPQPSGRLGSPGSTGRPGDRAQPPGRDPRGQREQRDDSDPRGNGSQRADRDRRDPDPWGQR